MVRQAQTYLAGAVSATALVSAAVVAFVLLVSLQALRDWPLAGLGGGGETAVAPARSAGSAGAAPVQAGGAGTVANSRAGAAAQGGGVAGTRQRGGSAALGTSPSPSGSTPAGEAPSPGAGGGSGGSAPGGSTPSSVGGGNGGAPASQPGAGSGQSTSGALTGAVNETVAGADETLGGPLGESGVTQVTETTVNGLAGPESTVGKTVDKLVETVGGVLGGGK